MVTDKAANSERHRGGTSGLDVRSAITGHLPKPSIIVAALTDDTDRSNVLSGENDRRLMQHVSVDDLGRVGAFGGKPRGVHILPPGKRGS